MTIAVAAQTIIGQARPVLLLDTCSILDVIRNATRLEPIRLSREMAAIDRIVTHVNNNQIYSFFCEEVHKELGRHQDTVLDEVRRWTKDVQISTQKFDSLHPNPGRIQISDDQVNEVFDAVEKKFSDLIAGSNVLEEDQPCFDRASRRNNMQIAPGHAGKQQGDCIIYEHYLELARTIRTQGFMGPIVFLTSNTSDYCDKAAPLPAIASEIDPLNVVLTTNFQWCLSKLA